MSTCDRHAHAGAALGRPRAPSRIYALTAGLLLLALGILTLATQPVGFGSAGALAEQPELLVWKVTGWSAAFWIGLGASGVLAALHLDSARDFALLGGLALATVATWGFVNGNDVLGLLAAGTAVNLTHAILGGLGLLVAALPRRARLSRRGDRRMFAAARHHDS